MDPKGLKREFLEKGLIQNGLFACGVVDEKNRWRTAGNILLFLFATGIPGHPLIKGKCMLFGITLVDGELVITPSDGKNILTDQATRLKRKDVEGIRLTTELGEMILIITSKDGDVFKCRILQHAKAIQKMIDLFNSQQESIG